MKKRTLLGTVGVDSGQVMVCDPCYIGSEWQKDDDKKELFDKSNEGKFSYGGCCIATMSEKLGGQLKYKLGHAGAGVAVSSGYGDGGYPVYAEYNDEGIVKRITVEFIADDVKSISDELEGRRAKCESKN
jgi:hypothetical protein